ncbi:MAG: M20/M25/M40 family metallo-hydrolase [Solirubrobacteraceae bacterium]|nr:M20/M25/M40 family metallo-hydrolase [Solirubrobacteraceae bacterium]
MRPASPAERRRLNETFAELCAIPSPTGSERAMADRVTAELTGLGLSVDEDDAGARLGGTAGNLLARMPGRDPEGRTILLCTHLDTVPQSAPIEPVIEDDAWINRNDGILGADNKAAVAVVLEVARRVAVEGAPVGLELLFTVAEEDALAGAKAFDAHVLQSDWGYVFDHATPIGEIIVAAPTYYRFLATFHGKAAHAGIRPEAGSSAVLAASRAIASMPLGRLDDQTTANVGHIQGGYAGATNVVPEWCTVLGECRSLDETRAEELVGELVHHLQDAANDPSAPCDVDIDVERLFTGYRHRPQAPAVLAAEEALSACGYAPTRIVTGGGSDAAALEVQGVACTNLANGTERNHQPDERVAVAALEGMLDVTFALLDACAAP